MRGDVSGLRSPPPWHSQSGQAGEGSPTSTQGRRHALTPSLGNLRVLRAVQGPTVDSEVAVRALVTAGANFDLPNFHGYTARGLAMQRPELEDLLPPLSAARAVPAPAAAL